MKNNTFLDVLEGGSLAKVYMLPSFCKDAPFAESAFYDVTTCTAHVLRHSPPPPIVGGTEICLVSLN